MSSRMFRYFSIDQIKDARNGFAKSKLLGQGGEGMVYRTNVRTEGKIKKVAAKRLHPERSNGLEKEIQTVPKIQHPHIVPLLGYCDQSGQKILVYEYMKKGSLSDYVGHRRRLCLSWLQRLQICLGAARGLQHLHAATDEFPKGIIHRDVKPENILLDENFVAKVSDLGMSLFSHSGQTKSSMATDLKGTRGFYAPEYLQCGHVTRKIDVYAFGVVLFQVLCQKMPWDRGVESYYRKHDEDLGLWAQNNVDGEIKGEITIDSLAGLVDIINRCLRIDPAARPTMDDVVLDLEKVLKCHNPTMDDYFVLDPNEMPENQDPAMEIGLVLDLDGVPKCQDPTTDIGLVADLDKVPKYQDPTMVGSVKDLDKVLNGSVQDLDKVLNSAVQDLDKVLKYQSGQNIFVYGYLKKEIPSDYVRDKRHFCLSWLQRLQICINVARELEHLHTAIKNNSKGMMQNVWDILHLKRPLTFKRSRPSLCKMWYIICAASSSSIHLKGVTKGRASLSPCSLSRSSPTRCGHPASFGDPMNGLFYGSSSSTSLL